MLSVLFDELNSTPKLIINILISIHSANTTQKELLNNWLLEKSYARKQPRNLVSRDWAPPHWEHPRVPAYVYARVPIHESTILSGRSVHSALEDTIPENREFWTASPLLHKFPILARRGKQEAPKALPNNAASENREFWAAPPSRHKFSILARRGKRSQKPPKGSKRQPLRIENSEPLHPLVTNSRFSRGEGRETTLGNPIHPYL